jgi:hypothetical protein
VVAGVAVIFVLFILARTLSQPPKQTPGPKLLKLGKQDLDCSKYRWRFYAFKTINGTTYYSNWSKEMQYSSPNHLYDTDNLYLTRTSPPDPIPPFYAQE